MGFLRRARNALTYVTRHGFRSALAYAIERVSEGYHEWRLGIRTDRVWKPDEWGVDSPFAVEYDPSDYRSIYKAFRRLRIRPGQDSFLDYGCGMGRVLVVAGTYPFRRVIGIELSAKLAAMANENLQRARSKLKCRDAEVIQADAAAYQVPADVTVVFFYNPFHGPVLSSALAAIHASLAQTPRRLWVVFKNPTYLESVTDTHPWLVKQDEFSAFDADHKVMIFEARL